jgi:hypothetical protein
MSSHFIAVLVIVLLSLAAFPSAVSFHVSTPIHCSHRSRAIAAAAPMGGLRMGGNNAAFGIFSPAVYVAKLVLGEAKLNKVTLQATALIRPTTQPMLT